MSFNPHPRKHQLDKPKLETTRQRHKRKARQHSQRAKTVAAMLRRIGL